MPNNYLSKMYPIFVACIMACNSEPQKTDTFHGYVKIVQIADLNTEELSYLPAQARDSIVRDGWNVTTHGLERSKIFERSLYETYHKHDFILTANGIPIEWHSDGSFLAKNIPITDGISPEISIIINGTKRTAPFISTEIIASQNGTSDININWYKLRESAHTHTDSTSGLLTSEPVPCLDFNGPYGDCVNYSSGASKYLNFIKSDCYYAWIPYGLCWLDFFGNGDDHYCDNMTNCSHFIGHPAERHCH